MMNSEVIRSYNGKLIDNTEFERLAMDPEVRSVRFLGFLRWYDGETVMQWALKLSDCVIAVYLRR